VGLESDSTAAIHALTSSNPAPTPMAALLHVHEADDFGLEVRLGMPVAAEVLAQVALHGANARRAHPALISIVRVSILWLDVVPLFPILAVPRGQAQNARHVRDFAGGSRGGWGVGTDTQTDRRASGRGREALELEPARYIG